jgi:hypothetical protein
MEFTRCDAMVWRCSKARCVAVCLLLFSVTCVFAGERQESQPLTGNLRVDLFGLKELTPAPGLAQDQASMAMPSHKSPWLAAGMSAVIPGSGQLYTHDYWTSALFLAVDVAAWIVAYNYDKKGDKQTDKFQNYANANWSVVKYAEYTQANLLPAGTTYNWRKAGTEGMDPFDRPWTQVNWDEINRMERDIGGYYSHNLPPYNEQQYYELIGKYPQFNQGWRDADPSIASDYESIKGHLTPMFLWYAGERGIANEHYRHATTWVSVAIVNHLLSAAEAAWSAIRFNKAQPSFGLRLVPAGDGYAWVGVATIKIVI